MSHRRASPQRRRRGWVRAAYVVAVFALVVVVGVAVKLSGHLTPTPTAGTATGQAPTTAADTGPSSAAPAAPPPDLAPVPPPADPALATRAVAAADHYNATYDGVYGVAVFDRANNKLVLGKYARTEMMSASVIKLFVIVDLLHQREHGDITLTSSDTKLIHRALSGSDDDAMNALWGKYSGPDALREIIKLAGLHHTEVPDDLAQWGEATISASDTVAVYRYLLTELRADDRDLVLDALSHPTHYGLADGFNQSFGLLDPDVRPPHVAAKQGWLGFVPYHLLHTSGLVGAQDQYITVVLSRQSNGTSYPTAEAHVSHVTAALLRALGPAVTS